MPGDESAFEPFVRACTPALLRTAFLLTGDAAAAEELVQDTLVHLYPQWGRVAAASVPLAYVRRAVTNRFLNGRKAAAREIAVGAVPDLGPAATGADLGERDELWAMLRALPARQRAALVLRYYDDLPDADIAAALRCRQGTVRSLVSRGLASLRSAAHQDADLGERSGR